MKKTRFAMRRYKGKIEKEKKQIQLNEKKQSLFVEQENKKNKQIKKV